MYIYFDKILIHVSAISSHVVHLGNKGSRYTFCLAFDKTKIAESDPDTGGDRLTMLTIYIKSFIFRMEETLNASYLVSKTTV